MRGHSTAVIVAKLPTGNRAVANHGGEYAGEAREQPTFAVALNPVDAVSRFLVDELDRRATETRDFDAALDAVRREGETAFFRVLGSADGDLVSTRNLALASVLGSERHETLMRQRLASARGFLTALHAIREVRASFPELGLGSLLAPDPRFATQQACAVHLVRRYVLGKCACSRCGAIAVGSFIAARACWQCNCCHAQTGLRHGTCMARSAVSLPKWFAAIRIVLLSPTIGTEELAAALKIDRRQTVRNMVKRIRAAVNGPDPSAALAGLDALYLGCG